MAPEEKDNPIQNLYMDIYCDKVGSLSVSCLLLIFYSFCTKGIKISLERLEDKLCDQGRGIYVFTR